MEIWQIPFEQIENPPKCVVYGAFNRASNWDCYVGATMRGLGKRKSSHLKCARTGERNYHFYNALKKYEPYSFHWRILEVCDSFEQALEAERKHIAILKPKYNHTLGGEGILGLCAESRAKLSANMKGNKNSLGAKRPKQQMLKLSKFMIGNKRGIGNKSRTNQKANSMSIQKMITSQHLRRERERLEKENSK